MDYACTDHTFDTAVLSLLGVVHADLKLFLETNLSMAGKKKAMLGVSDSKIGAALQEELELSIQTGGVVAELLRGENTPSNCWRENKSNALYQVWGGGGFKTLN